MGYSSAMECNVKIKLDRKEHFLKAVEEAKKKRAEIQKKAGYNQEYEFVDEFLLELEIAEDGNLEYDDYYQKWYADEEFVKFLAPYVREGTLRFVGEDGERWGYHFDGKGGIRLLRFIEEIEDDEYYKAPEEIQTKVE